MNQYWLYIHSENQIMTKILWVSVWNNNGIETIWTTNGYKRKIVISWTIYIQPKHVVLVESLVEYILACYSMEQ